MTRSAPPGLGPRVVLVTGANRGIGHELARQLTLRGDAVVLTARDLTKAERAAAALPGHEPVLARRLDVTDPASVQQVAADLDRRYGRLDVRSTTPPSTTTPGSRPAPPTSRPSKRRWRSTCSAPGRPASPCFPCYTETLIGVLGELHRFLGGEKATLLWDGLPATAAGRCRRSWPASAAGWWWSGCPPTRRS
jgi:short chain dehydrogenase